MLNAKYSVSLAVVVVMRLYLVFGYRTETLCHIAAADSGALYWGTDENK